MLATKAMRGAGWLIISRFAGRGIDFLTLLLLTRVLTPADFGLAALAISLVVVTDSILDVPITQALLRLPEIDRTHLDTAFTLGCIRNCLLATIILCAAWPFSLFNHNLALMPLVSVLAIAPVVRGLYSPAMVHFTRRLGFGQTFVMEFSGKFCAFIAAAVTVYSGGSYWAIAANFVTTSVAATFASYLLAPYWPRYSLARLSDFRGIIGWFNTAQVISALNWQFDRFYIGIAADNNALGRYAVAADVSIIPLQSLIGPALQPTMAAFAQIVTDTERLKIAFLKTTRVAMLIAVPIAVGISITSDLVIDILFGAKWEEAAPILRILSIALIPAVFFQNIYSVCVALNRPFILFRLNSIDFFIKICLFPLGFYIDYITGVAFARLTLSIIMLLIYIREVSRILSIGIAVQLRGIWKMFASGVVMGAVVMALRQESTSFGWSHLLELVFVSCVGGFVYFLALFLLGVRAFIGKGRVELSDVVNPIARWIR